MRQWSHLLETAVAPSPIVRTSRHSPALSGCEYHDKSSSTMSAMAPSHDTRMLQARPAGAAERPMVNENVVELVRFFQASNASSVSPVSPVLPQNASTNNIFKAGHRRLRQFTMRQKKDSDSKSKSDDSYQHLMSVQRGQSPAVSKSKSSQLKGSSEPALSHSRSLDTMFTNSKSEVENIGQPWLEDTSERNDQRAHRLSPLDIEEFTSMIKAAESSCAHVRDETPPSYEQSIQSRPSTCSAQPPATTENHNLAARSSGESPDRPGSLESGAAGTSQPGENGNTAQSNETTNMSNSHQHAEGNGHPGDEDSSEITALPREPGSQHGNPAAEKSKQEVSENHGASEYGKRPSSSTSITERTSQRSFSQPLKLFPEPPPPRTSSKGMWKAQGSRRPSLASSAASDEKKLPSVTEARSDSPMPQGNVRSQMDPIPRPHTATDTRPVENHSKENANSDKNGGPAFLSMDKINAFPLPAPNRPPPELPKVPPIKESHKKRTERFNNSAVPANANPRSLRQLSRFPSASGWKMLSENAARSSSPRPAACSGALPVQRGSSAEQDWVSQGSSSHQPSSMAVTPQSRADKVRALRMKDISQRRHQLNTGKLAHEDATLALPQAGSTPIERRNHDLKVDTGRRLQRVIAPDPASPPPSSPLPLDPPIRPPNADSHGRRYRNSPPSSIKVPISRSAATSPDLGRSPQIKRSDSTRSASICHDIISNEKKSFDYSDSPIPSSDDEGRGTARSSRAFSSRRAKRSARRSDSSALRITPHTRKQLHSDFIPPLSPRSEATTRSPPQSPRSDNTFRSTEQSASIIQSLETRVANLERQNKILQAALAAALDASGNQIPDGLFNSLASFSGPKASPDTGRSVSSLASNSSSMDESAWSMKQGKANLKSSSVSRLDKWNATRDSSSFSSLESSMKDDGSHAKELEHAMRDLEYGWLPSVGETQAFRNPQSL